MSPDEKDRYLNEQIARGNEARAILENPLVKEALQKLKDEIVKTWSECPARDTDGREWLWQHYQATLKFETLFIEALNGGKIALKERQLSLLERGKQFFRG